MERKVEPKLIVQVQDTPGGPKKGRFPTRANLEACIDTINGALTRPLGPHEFAHAFGDAGVVGTGSHDIRPVEPEAIADDPAIRVVFFKEALSTGWDCPPAEVMMSFRTARDETYIARLIGRMVRNPLARQIVGNEHLNSVDLFLPRYDEENVDRIVKLLTEDSERTPPTEVVKATAILPRAEETEEIFDVLERLPSYTIPHKASSRQTERLIKLASRLARHNILDENAVEEAKRVVIDVLDEHLTAKRGMEGFRRSVEGKGTIEVGRKVFGLRGLESEGAGVESVSAESRDIDRIFAVAGRQVGENLHKDFWKHLCESVDTLQAGGFEEVRALKNTVVVLLADQEVVKAVEDAAEALADEWLSAHNSAINGLSRGRRNEYRAIRGGSRRPTEKAVEYPLEIVGASGDGVKYYTGHAYSDEKDLHGTTLNRLESKVLCSAQGLSNFLGWLRNEPRKAWSLCVPYQGQRQEWFGFYPDFLIFREGQDGCIVVDILDPHSTSQADAVAKARGMAVYAKDHGHYYGRIVLADQIDGSIRFLDVKDGGVREMLLNVDNAGTLTAIYKAKGTGKLP